MARRVIVYVGGFELPDRNAAAQRLRANAKLLQTLGYTVVSVGIHRTPEDRIQKIAHDGSTTFTVRQPSSVLEWVKRYLSAKPYLDIVKAIPQSELRAIVLYNEKSLLQFRLRAWAKKRGIKFVADATEWYAHAGWSPLTLFKKLDTAVRMHLLNPIADGLITTSPFMTKYYTKRGFRSERMVELPTLFDTSKSPVQNRGIENTTLRLVYSGSPFNLDSATARHRMVKDRLDSTIDVYLRIRNHRTRSSLAIYGVTKAQFLFIYPEYEARLAECGDSVIFHGRVPNSVVLEALADAAFSIFFRDQNRVTLAGFPTKFAESVTQGTPVITNLLPSIQKYASPGQNCLLMDPADASDTTPARIAALTASEISAMKSTCLESKQFDYNNFLEPMRRFVRTVGI